MGSELHDTSAIMEAVQDLKNVNLLRQAQLSLCGHGMEIAIELLNQATSGTKASTLPKLRPHKVSKHARDLVC